MNEQEFIQRWGSEKPIYEAWGNFIVNTVKEELIRREKEIESFLKIQPSWRLKQDGSLIDKAFYRSGKSYTNPYEEIEDKVGVRFVVLLIDDINFICDVIKESDIWTYDPCKHFDDERRAAPQLFTYQSVHFILRPKSVIKVGTINIPSSIPCEVQIRTLLQHAHSELTHDAIYKAQRTIDPIIHRKVARSMALIETTDDLFTNVTDALNSGPVYKHDIANKLDGLYTSFVGIKPVNQKSSLIVLDQFEKFIDGKLAEKIQALLNEHEFLASKIKDRFYKNSFFQQSAVLFIYWMLKKRRKRLLTDWPLDRSLLEPLATDLGVNTFLE